MASDIRVALTQKHYLADIDPEPEIHLRGALPFNACPGPTHISGEWLGCGTDAHPETR